MPRQFRSRAWIAVAGALLGAGFANGQTPASPVIAAFGVVNGASFTHPTFPGGALAQGTIFSIFGTNLGPAIPPPAPNSYPLGTTLGDVSIRLTSGATTVNALPFFVSAGQVSAILPSNTVLGTNTLVLTYAGRPSNAFSVQVVASSVGLFAINSGGFGPAVAQNFFPDRLPINSRSAAAKPGQIMTLYGTGLGAALNPDTQAPQAGDLAARVEIFVGGKPGKNLYTGRSPCCSGLDQFTFELPADVPLGCNVPTLVRSTAGSVATSSNVVTLAISTDGTACADAIAPLGSATGSGRSGNILLVRADAQPATGSTAVMMDLAVGAFRRDVAGDFAFNPIFSAPPVGACTVYAARGNAFVGDDLPGFSASGDLRGGNLSVTSGSRTVSIAGGTQGYFAFLGIGVSQPGGLPASFYGNGPFQVAGVAGPDVGAFTTSVPAAPILAWTNRSQTSSVNRAAGLTVNWSFSGAGAADVSGSIVVVAGGVFDRPARTSSVFFCVANAAAGNFAVPPYILSRVIPSAASSESVVFVGALPRRPLATFTATGLDQGVANFVSLSGRYLPFQ